MKLFSGFSLWRSLFFFALGSVAGIWFASTFLDTGDSITVDKVKNKVKQEIKGNDNKQEGESSSILDIFQKDDEK